MTANARRSRAGPRATTIPNSACRPRIWFIKAARSRISSDRTRCSASMSCCATLLTATNRIDDRPAASQIASASRASFLFDFTYGRTKRGLISLTSCPRLAISRARPPRGPKQILCQVDP
jgi:hypothetical protein